MKQLNWDNLRYVLMVANQGSISAAARELNVNRSTVLRRIERFQEDLNCQIFNRSLDGYALTPEAEKMIEAAREVESTLFDMQRMVEGRELRPEGKLRVTTTLTLLEGLLAEPLARFRQRYPQITLDLLVTNRVLDLARRDADIAIRPVTEPDPGFTAHKLCDVSFSIYQSSNEKVVKNWKRANWIGVTDLMQTTPIGDWFDRAVNPDRVVVRCDSLVAALSCAEAGMGLSLLPTALGDPSSKLRRVEGVDIEFTSRVWLLTHPDLVRSARVNAFIEHLMKDFGNS